MTSFLTRDRALAILALASAGAFLFALFSQHVLGMQPCAWCILQRMICVAIAIVAGIGWLARRSGGVASLCLAMGFLLGIGGAIAAWYQHTVAAHAFTCDLSFADQAVTLSGLDMLLPQAFGIYATCADSAVDLLGVRYEIWTLILFVVMALVALIGLSRGRPAA